MNFDYITNQKCDVHLSFGNAHGRRVQRVKSKWNIEEFSLNTESFVDLNSKKFKSVERLMEKF